MKLSAALFASCYAVLTPYFQEFGTAPGDGTKCFLECQRKLFDHYIRCSLEWGYGTDDFWRCYDGAETEFERCFAEDCPQDACDKLCIPPWKEGYYTCDELYNSGALDTIGYVICINKISADMINCVETCFCDQYEANGTCTCYPINPPFGLESFSPRWSACIAPDQ
ncbi:Oidioi.mRNA.OKI2018_I69.chr2.g4300.t1.cds [Oikopleura dioica]|uniref:Oidioi.mRNA.OKI2018_I69.chr2.g4300.t1.cds n=1 Tax=Oikopleura dioica TaxID=34765 RepID=A0ABN7T0R9_OIKDI|nr:Oidioi.mRNA.OKI2018_I69.chr2.g4300.t1.cds [Oikopleura dioica]